jgi:S1-C subfamily serine protease
MADTVEAASAGVVRVEGRRRFGATGIIWREGIVVTANHVVRRDDGIKVGLPGGDTVEATVAGRDPSTDIAVLRVSGAANPASLADNGALRVGHLVLALGRPFNQVQATHGVVSAIGIRRDSGIIQTDVVMYPGFSGGPLVDASGNVQGMNTSGLNRGASLAIGTERINRIVSTLLEHGRMQQGFLGVGAQPARLPEAVASEVGQETGLLLVAVEPNSPAEAAGLLLGDVIISLDGEPTPHLDALLGLLSAERIGQGVPVKVLRGGALQEIDVTIGEKA